MNDPSQLERFGILPWVVALLCLGGLFVALYADYVVAQARLLP